MEWITIWMKHKKQISHIDPYILLFSSLSGAQSQNELYIESYTYSMAPLNSDGSWLIRI